MYWSGTFFFTRNKTSSFLLVVDWISLSFIISVIIIRLRVYFFRAYYIEQEVFFSRFHYILRIFILRMLVLILSPNLISLLLGWDGLGLSSFLLVIYYRRKKSFGAGFLTALRNRVGDGLILLSIPFLIRERRLRIIEIRLCEWNSSKFFIFVLITAFFTKRAQIPFSAWLPAAMAAPTPVSALVHSSTLVTAGVYLLIRFTSFNIMWLELSKIILIIGIVTIVIASLRAFFEQDIKKIVALSTLRQLGVITVRVGLQQCDLRFFHLLAHAFFKAILFISRGVLIHNSNNYQDLRFIGNKALRLPLTSSIVIVRSFRLCGLPFMSAFFSKEPVLEILIVGNFHYLTYLIFLAGVGITLFYRLRIFIFRIVLETNHTSFTAFGEAYYFLYVSYLGLFFLARRGGLLIRWVFFLNNRLFMFSKIVKVSPLLCIVMFIAMFIVYIKTFTKIKVWGWSLGNLWSLPLLATRVIIQRFNKRGVRIRVFDQRWVSFIFNSFKFAKVNLINFRALEFFTFLSSILIFLGLFLRV